jgi:carbamate kinase
MRPKIDALVEFVSAHPGSVGVINDPPNLARALRREAGTWIENPTR